MAQSIRHLIKTSSRVVPMIYAYTTPGVTYHDGYIKIGYTEQDVETRIRQQTHTAGVMPKIEWKGTAVYDDGTGDTFIDKDFHAYLRKLGVKQPQDLGNEYFDPKDRNEWFFIEPTASRNHYNDFRSNRGDTAGLRSEIVPYTLREEQEEAVRQTVAYRNDHARGEFLWNAKPRFGKTLSTYDFILRTKAEKVLIVTNRPAIANSWYQDYEKFVGRQGGYFFVSSVDGVAKKPLVISYDHYEQDAKTRADMRGSKPMGLIDFVSLQDLKGSMYFGGHYDKLREVREIRWDILVIDEAHEGVDTYRTDVAFDQISRGFTLHLSGTPFKALANEKFREDAIYNWTYADEQKKKNEWSGAGENPYATLPKLNMFTYQMSEIIKDELSQGVEIEGETEEYAFDLNEFFATDGSGKFKHDSSVDRFLDALTTQEKFPFSTPELRDELKHTFWILDRVDSAKALARRLEDHPVFGGYEIILAAGDGKLDDADETMKSYDKVMKAIAEKPKTITLSVGQLTTGVTVPEWTAVLMLSNMKSPALYMQAAFRAQNPCLFHDVKKGSYRKENAYVFDFDPARTLMIFEQFANDLTRDTAAGHGDIETRKKHIKELLNFFPVIGEDADGEMIELDAEKVLSIPRKIKSKEVVRRGFMSDFLFQNISNIFRAPQEVVDILSQFTPVSEPKLKGKIDPQTMHDIPLNDDGEVDVPESLVVGVTQDVFGDKIYRDLGEAAQEIIEKHAAEAAAGDDKLEKLKKHFRENIVAPVIEDAKNHYGDEMKKSDEKQITNRLNVDSDRRVEKTVTQYDIDRRTLEKEREDALRNRLNDNRSEYDVNREFDQKQKDAAKKFTEDLTKVANEFIREASEETVRTVETRKEERKKESIESTVRDHLRGFSRTIPSFLMAYGDDGVTLATFDGVIPADVFKEVTSISIEQFRFLRDGGDYIDENGEQKHFDGNLFDPVVFDDSVKEFLAMRARLANYFDESNTEDIFDYIAPQKTNQIFTPKKVVKMMVDKLEEQNPGCFDDPTNTFADLYMKSGLYITEIVKRLFVSEKMKAAYPDDGERIRHILQKQVYGMAPTQIIYKIATNYILGFDETLKNETRNFVQADAAEAAKNGTLSELVDESFEG